MARLQCAACSGTYDSAQTDGTLYFHVCPPLAAWEIRQAIGAGASPLTAAQTKQLAALDATPTNATTGTTGPQLGDAYLQQLALARPGARNENIDPVKLRALRDPDTGNLPATVPAAAIQISPGAGAVALVPDATV